jgi:hypothetical protein
LEVSRLSRGPSSGNRQCLNACSVRETGQGLPSLPMDDEQYLFQTKSRAFAKRLKRDPHWIAGKHHYVVTTVLEMVPTPDRHEPRWLVRGRPERHDDRCPVAR